MNLINDYNKLRSFYRFLESNRNEISRGENTITREIYTNINLIDSNYLKELLTFNSPDASNPVEYIKRIKHLTDSISKIIEHLRGIIQSNNFKIWFLIIYVKNLNQPKYIFSLSGDGIPDLTYLNGIGCRIVVEKYDTNQLIGMIFNIVIGGGIKNPNTDELINFNNPLDSFFIDLQENTHSWFNLGGEHINFHFVDKEKFELNEDYSATVIYKNTPLGTLSDLLLENWFGCGTYIGPGVHIVIGKYDAIIQFAKIIKGGNCHIKINLGKRSIDDISLSYTPEGNNLPINVLSIQPTKTDFILNNIGEKYIGGRIMLHEKQSNVIIHSIKFEKASEIELSDLLANLVTVIHSWEGSNSVTKAQDILNNYFQEYTHKVYLLDMVSEIIKPFQVQRWKERKNIITNMIKTLEELLKKQSSKLSITSLLSSNPKPRLFNFIKSFQSHDRTNYTQSVNNISASTGNDWYKRYNQIITYGLNLNVKYWWNRIHLLSNNTKHGSTIEYMLRSYNFWVEVYTDFLDVLLDLENIP